MTSTIHFPTSPSIDAVPADDVIAEIADEALKAFFKVVCDRIDDLYPDGETTGDVDPGELRSRMTIAEQWVCSHALNHPAVAAANE
jgi:hypothetical protein